MPPPPPWSDIPLELAGLVVGHLPAHVDRVRFAAVCRRWRAAASEVVVPPPNPPLPLLLLPDGAAYSFPHSEPFRFPACVCPGYAAASGNWLLYSRGDDDACCFLIDPFSNATVPLPALHRVRRQRMSGKAAVDVHDGGVDADGGGGIEEVVRLLVCSPRLVAALVRLENRSRADIAVCRPGASSRWSVCMDDCGGVGVPLLGSMAFHDGNLFATHLLRADLYAIDISVNQNTGHPWVSQVRKVIDDAGAGATTARRSLLPYGVEMFYLVESRGGALLMVRREMQSVLTLPGKFVATWRNTFQVFRADLEESKWTEMSTIGDEVLFLSGQQCRSVDASAFGIRGDLIFFFQNDDEPDEDCNNLYEDESPCSCSLHDIRDKKVYNLPIASWKRGPVRAAWLFPQSSS